MKRDVAQDVTNVIMEALENGTVPWRQPWHDAGHLPRSMSTRKPYRGMNRFLLGLAPYESPWWGTFKQVQALGGRVIKGQKGSLVVFYKPLKIEEKDPSGGDPKEKTIPLLRYFTVFNANQCEGLGDAFYHGPEDLRHDWERIAECEQVMKDWENRGPTFFHTGDGAYYVPKMDAIYLPPNDSFPSRERYYSTAFHEMTHSTGHEKRLNREGVRNGYSHRFGDELYSKEELIAEMGAAILCGYMGIEQAETMPQSAAYIASWLKALKNDKKLVLSAAAGAEKAVALIYPNANDESEGQDA